MKVSTKLLNVVNNDDFLELETNGAKFRVYLLDENIIRMRGTFDDEFAPEESYALTKTAWDDKTDKLLGDERTRVQAIKTDPKKTEFGYTVSTGKYTLNIYQEPFAFEIVDENGNIVHQDLAKRAFLQDDNGRSFHYSSMGDHNYFYGFGEKSGELNKFKRRMRMHNTDSLGWNAKKSDPLYKMIPFYIDFNGEDNIASGLYYNNSHDSVFDMDSEHSNYWKRFSYFECDGGELDVFFIGGPTIKKVVEHYTDLTGKSAMMPLPSFGYMGSTMYYTELDENADVAILDFVDTCKKYGIPCDGFFLSSGYTSGKDGKRYVFNWNKTRFPNPQDFVNKLKEKGVLLAPNIKPGMLTTHFLTKDFQEHDAYVKTSDGRDDQVDQYWGGNAHFVDFTSEAGRQEWAKHMTDSLLSLGITSIWNDNNEYEINDNNAVVDAEGLKKKIGAVKPLMSTMMAKTAKDAINKYNPDARPYLVNRAGFAGIQRYAQTWAGDNRTSWTNVKYNVPTILGMGLSGVANQGCDIGGFDGPAPEPELFVRWVQNGIFQPRFSIHSSNDDNTVTEPWMYPQYTSYIRDAIKLRYTLIPYFYSLLYEASTIGSPIMRPLVYEFQDDPKVAEESFEFMLGSSLLIANVLDKGQTVKGIYLPEGSDWYEIKTAKYYQGGQTIEVPVDLSSIPMFLRTGGIVPRSPEISNLHNDIIDKLDLLIEPSVKSSFTVYEDDGKTNDYKRGQSLETTFDFQPLDGGVLVNVTQTGKYQTKVKNMVLSVCCPGVAPFSVSIDGIKVEQFLNFDKFENADEGWYFNGESRQVEIKYANRQVDKYQVQISFSVKDLISI
ncbi:TIM-barrel domain-containing protein [Paucilactobacillus suebicus]|uniref:Alpha-glucosidase n=1 Tax=Paucilactobacillus suebicus DSM 5007 = KCTC 3549 TaxID=1423807 RepID=A0A0R1W389_9LACO|nr:TIM-barrel domain-containing protein [Paucilactobacillus suebicus]KRM12151.1 alpha-glucosidase [Paucilactobacillus suebicus DSM 5007 = KCTC 3549]